MARANPTIVRAYRIDKTKAVIISISSLWKSWGCGNLGIVRVLSYLPASGGGWQPGLSPFLRGGLFRTEGLVDFQVARLLFWHFFRQSCPGSGVGKGGGHRVPISDVDY